MINDGISTLGDIAITAAGTYIGNWTGSLDGIAGATFDLQFIYGSGGTSGKVYLQTSLRDPTATTDPGIDVACMTFAQATKSKVFDIEAAPLTFTTPTDGALTDDTILQGALGTKFRLKIITLGTYATQTLISGRLAARG